MSGIGVLDAIDSFDTQVEITLDLLVRTMLPNVMAFAGVLMSIFVAIKVIKSWLGEGEKLDTNTLVRPCVTLAALSLYPTLVDLLMFQPVDLITSIVNNGGSSGDLDAMRDVMTHSQDVGGDDGGGVYDIIQIHDTLEFFHMILFFAASMVGGYVLFKQVLMKAIYYMLGPFALAFSLITGNEKVVSKWFQGFFAVLLWVPVFDILRAIITSIPIHATEFSNADIIFSVCFQIVMVFAVFKVPEYANVLVSQGSSIGGQSVAAMGGKAQGKAAGMAMGGAKKAGGAAWKGAKAAGGAMKKKRVAGSEGGGGRPKLERQNASKRLGSSSGGSSSGTIGGKGGKGAKIGAAAKKAGGAALRAGGSAAQKAGREAKRKLAFGGGKPGSSGGTIGGKGGRPKLERQNASSNLGSSSGGSSSGSSSSSSGTIGGKGGKGSRSKLQRQNATVGGGSSSSGGGSSTAGSSGSSSGGSSSSGTIGGKGGKAKSNSGPAKSGTKSNRSGMRDRNLQNGRGMIRNPGNRNISGSGAKSNRTSSQSGKGSPKNDTE